MLQSRKQRRIGGLDSLCFGLCNFDKEQLNEYEKNETFDFNVANGSVDGSIRWLLCRPGTENE